jgi:dTDP-4-dehydrorhamnose 3,5-epimerase
MTFRPTAIHGVLVAESVPQEDERGSFERLFCTRELGAHGVDFAVAQTNLSRNRSAGTLRGMHHQADPEPENKLVRCLAGKIFDVAVDLRPTSPTHTHWVGQELNEDDHRALVVPAGCAHGFITLVDNSDVLYLMGAHYNPALSHGVRWNDPVFSIDWPMRPTCLSSRDATYPDYVP